MQTYDSDSLLKCFLGLELVFLNSPPSQLLLLLHATYAAEVVARSKGKALELRCVHLYEPHLSIGERIQA